MSVIGAILEPHDRYERATRGEEIEQAYENDRRAAHKLQHGSLHGFQPTRAFPCRGSLTVRDEIVEGRRGQLHPVGTVLFVMAECDACGYQLGARVASRPRDEREAEREREVEHGEAPF